MMDKSERETMERVYRMSAAFLQAAIDHKATEKETAKALVITLNGLIRMVPNHE
jgi:hypothetical protein